MRMRKTVVAVRSYFYNQRWLYLFITLLLPYILHPLIETEIVGIAIMDFAFMLVLVVSAFAMGAHRRMACFAIIIMVLSQVLTWSSAAFHNVPYKLVAIAVTDIYLIYTTSFVLHRILVRRDVTSNTIFASLCVYLLIAYAWAMMYAFLETIVPGSFAIDSQTFQYKFGVEHVYAELYYLMYYSFTSLTTLGLGDIMPSSPWARVLTALEAIIGQIYLVVLVSRLVGMHISQRRQEL